MGVTRILDLVVILLLATILLMPRPDASVKPALAGDAEVRGRVAELQSILTGRPGDADASLELANIFLDAHRPDWALATVSAALKAQPRDYRLFHLRAIAYADRFEAPPAADSAKEALALCNQSPPPEGAPPCGEAARSRLALLASTLEAVSKVDMKKQPYLAKERIFEQLHPVFIPKRKPTPDSKSATPAAKRGPPPAAGTSSTTGNESTK